ncbi:hypothetical protein TOT_040000813 [Theileria orientalis strain Shintoku]|uniref:Uncharacterized protein n=1 Tax=Theileria orientalis strain Shintoku TaxID=869250 RepID=J7MH08_THEOR|nr:hypothetical protein TOT_040000813 [Theileria orientalis strain Shintoku]BAM42446.1 hypothetical protein TOT_040000813 [Theileria orientalis strain Shintoku]|eukprot:XP_009692747.1 hypothetical protein TOT_040000813 [Theileria orientalis strain Shintoku]
MSNRKERDPGLGVKSCHKIVYNLDKILVHAMLRYILELNARVGYKTVQNPN